MASDLYIGLMSGTSLDGIDAVLADFSLPAPLVRAHFGAIPPTLRNELRRLLQPGADELASCAVIGNELAARYAAAVEVLLRDAGKSVTDIVAIGCHGQTVRHVPSQGYTVQLVNGALLAEQTGIAVVCDFRSRDVAAGGQGAPLAPAFHRAMFHDRSVNRVIVNLGGIANLTWLPAAGLITGFDCGPANALMDEWAEQHLGSSYDDAGSWASGGQVLTDLLASLSADPYFARCPPKSTGREYFDIKWAHAHLKASYQPQDVQATFAELSASVLAAGIERYYTEAEEVLLCGGGVANADLVQRIGRLLSPRKVTATTQLGVDPDWVEALAFAWLARETLAGRPGNVPQVTGARGARVLGCIYPA
jgi:anhydro-N-acetylmuramic acid kinase